MMSPNDILNLLNAFLDPEKVHFDTKFGLLNDLEADNGFYIAAILEIQDGRLPPS